MLRMRIPHAERAVYYKRMLRDHPEGCVLAVRAQPGAKKRGLIGMHGEALKLAVQAPADQGKANAALVDLLAELLDVRPRQIELLSGQTNRSKSFLVRGLTAAAARTKLGL